MIASCAQAACSRDRVAPTAVVLRGVPDHAGPAAADVELPHAGLQVVLAADQVVLERLRLLERRVLGREARARVGHRRAEDHLVEPVRHVVVVVDRLGVAALGVPEALHHSPPARQRFLRRRLRRQEVAQPETAREPHRLARRRHPDLQPLLQVDERVVGVAGVHTLDLEVAAHVGAGQAEVAGGGEQVGQAALVAQVEPDRRVLRAGGAAVVRREPEGQPTGHEALDGLTDRHRVRAGGGRAVERAGHRRSTAFS